MERVKTATKRNMDKIRRLTRRKIESPNAVEGAKLLSPREIQIVRLVAQGKMNKEIGKLCKITPKTVESHRASIYKKLQVRNTAEVIHFALASGLVRLRAQAKAS
jgi:DNA-binding NarL/FixJ family response regulator